MARTTLKKEKVDLYHAEFHSKAWQRWLQVVYVLPCGADQQTKERVFLHGTDPKLSPKRICRFYRALFQIEFVFRDAKQHLSPNDYQARSQAKLHFHFNTVFAALFRARRRARKRAEGPLGPFSLRNLKRHDFEEEIHKRIGARLGAGRNAPNSGAGRPWNTVPGLPHQVLKCVRTIEAFKSASNISRPSNATHPLPLYRSQQSHPTLNVLRQQSHLMAQILQVDKKNLSSLVESYLQEPQI